MAILDASTIGDLIALRSAARLEHLEVFASIDSTNTYLMSLDAPSSGMSRVAIAEHQTAGRGRRENAWVSAPGGSLCLSMAYTFESLPAVLPPLTLALGVSLANAFVELGVADIRLKWPNDILVNDAKLGGILTETRHHGSNVISVVVGIGVNVNTPDVVASVPSESWAYSATDLVSAMPEPPTHNHLAAAMIDACQGAFEDFEKKGFAGFENRYQSYDWLAGKSVVVETSEGDIEGIVAGIDSIGALLVDANGGQKQVISGSVKHVAMPEPA